MPRLGLGGVGSQPSAPRGPEVSIRSSREPGRSLCPRGKVLRDLCGHSLCGDGKEGVTLGEDWQRGSGQGKKSPSAVSVAAVAGSGRTLGVGFCVPCVFPVGIGGP